MTKALRRVPSRVGKEVAHLTYARQDVTPEAKVWPHGEISRDLMAVVEQFLNEKPPRLFGERWDHPEQL